MAVKLGTNPIAWTNDDMPELGGETPLETCLKEAAAAGFKGIEKGGKFPNDAPSVQAVLGKYGLELVSGWYSGELRTRSVEEEIAAMRPHFDLLKACGCPGPDLCRDRGHRAGQAQRAGGRPPGDGRGRVARLPREDRPARRLDGRERRAAWPSTITWAR